MYRFDQPIMICGRCSVQPDRVSLPIVPRVDIYSVNTVSGVGLAVLAAPAGSEPTPVTWTAAVIAWALAVPLYFITQRIATIPHEGGHALLAKLFGRKLESIRFGRDGGGATKPAETMPWLVFVIVALAGYLGPSLFGMAAAWLLTAGHTEAVLWSSLGFLLFMLFAVRGWIGWIIVPALMAGIYAVAVYVEPAKQVVYAHVWTWFLLIVAVEEMFVVLRRRIYRNEGSDQAVLQRLTHLPAALWAFVMLVGTIAALAYGGSMLLRS